MSKKAEPKTTVTTERTSAGLRAMLFDELDALRNGSSNATRANAVAKMAGTVIETVRMELDVAKYAERNKLTPQRAAKALTTAIDLAA